MNKYKRIAMTIFIILLAVCSIILFIQKVQLKKVQDNVVIVSYSYLYQAAQRNSIDAQRIINNGEITLNESIQYSRNCESIYSNMNTITSILHCYYHEANSWSEMSSAIFLDPQFYNFDGKTVRKLTQNDIDLLQSGIKLFKAISWDTTLNRHAKINEISRWFYGSKQRYIQK